MVRKQIHLQRRQGPQGLAAELAHLSENRRLALFAALDAYEATGVRFALVGGLAVGAYGEPRATKDIDFLVGDEAFVRSGPIISYAHHFPLEAYGTPIDVVPLPELPASRWRILNEELHRSDVDTTTGRPVPILSARGVAFMKLIAMRPRDVHDVVSMLDSGAVTGEGLAAMVQGDFELEQALEAVWLKWDPEAGE